METAIAVASPTAVPRPNQIQQRADFLRAYGFDVFPCWGLTSTTPKRPRYEWKNASANLHRTFKETDLIGVSMPPGTVALDIDNPTAFDALGVSIPETVSSASNRDGGQHYYFQTDRPIKQETDATKTNGYDTRVGGKGYVIAWHPEDWLPVSSWSHAPDWLYTRQSRATAASTSPQTKYEAPMGTRSEILSWLGTIARGAALTETEYLGLLIVAQKEGRIVDLDPNRPWTSDDLTVLAREAANWETVTTTTYSSHTSVTVGTDEESTALLRVRAKRLEDIDRSEAPPLIVDRISPDGHTILFGPGDAGKGLLASSWITQHVKEGGRVLILDFEDHPEEWARRIVGLGGIEVLTDSPVVHISPLKLGEPKWSDLAAASREHEATLIVLDSVGFAIPGKDPSEAQSATALSKAIQQFEIPVLSLAHMTKAGDARYPYGSTFWHAGARVTWSLVPDGPDGSKLQNRKHNNYEWQGAYSVTSEWWDNIPRNVHEKSYTVSITDRITEILTQGPASNEAIIEALNADETSVPIKANTIRQALSRGLKDRQKLWTKEGEFWIRTHAGD